MLPGNLRLKVKRKQKYRETGEGGTTSQIEIVPKRTGSGTKTFTMFRTKTDILTSKNKNTNPGKTFKINSYVLCMTLGLGTKRYLFSWPLKYFK